VAILSEPNKLAVLSLDFLTAWQEAHGFKAGRSTPIFSPKRFVIRIEGAFSEAEHKLAETQSGKTLLEQYAIELLSDICDTMKIQIEAATERAVLSSEVNVNLDADQVQFIFHLGSV
jgi:uncharacterized protein YbcI